MSVQRDRHNGPIDRTELEHLFDQGLSLREVGERCGLTRSGVGKMAHRYGLVPPGRARFAAKPIDPEELSGLVAAGVTERQIAADLGVSISTARKHLKRHGLLTARAVRLREAAVSEREGEKALYLELTCRHHGRVRFRVEGRGSYRCMLCRAERVVAWRRRKKEQLVAEAGGRCTRCGYDRHSGALHFHHLDPTQKEFGLAQRGCTRSIDRLRAEASKCVLLCSNCHAEVEAGILTVEDCR